MNRDIHPQRSKLLDSDASSLHMLLAGGNTFQLPMIAASADQTASSLCLVG